MSYGRGRDQTPASLCSPLGVSKNKMGSSDQVVQPSQTTETGSSNPKKIKRVRGTNKCKEVALLEVGQNLKVTFYNNQTVGTNSKVFFSHLEKIVRDGNMCPLRVSSWSDIKQQKLDHMWAVVEVRSRRNATNPSKPIREIIYQKGEKDGNPSDLATIFFKTRKKENKLVEPEATEKHAHIKEMVKEESSLSIIEIVEKCCGPQNRSHVFSFGGEIKVTDMKGRTSSKADGKQNFERGKQIFE